MLLLRWLITLTTSLQRLHDVDSQPFKSVSIYDTLSVFPGGINSDVDPILLNRETLAWSMNASVRGGFVHQRPAFINQVLSYASPAVESGVNTGLFQGGGYFRPDTGPQQLVAQIGGRLFTFTPAGAQVDVAEITIPGDTNDPTVTQVWMNQAEKWLIITDGTSALPIFYDGVTTRRSYGPSVGKATTTAVGNFPSPRVIGEIITVTLTAPYTGPYDVPVLFNGHFYQPTSSGGGAGNQATLTNISATPGSAIPIGTMFESNPKKVGKIVSAGPYYTLPASGPFVFFIDVVVNVPVPATGGVNIGTGGFSRTSGLDISPTQITLKPVGPHTPINPGDLITTWASPPIVIVGTTTIANTNPALNGTVVVDLANPYLGPAGAQVWVGSDQYFITAVPPSSPGSTLNLINLSDTTDAGAAIPAESILSVPELPAGRMGAYGLGHQAMSLTDGISFIYGDAVGGPSGTVANDYRDAVLKTTENTFLTGGGAFRIPNSGEIITSMRFATVLDASYGQGPLQLGTPTSIFTCAVPTDRAVWILLTNPILTQTLIGRGPLAQNSTISVNSDVFFRTTDGLGSMVFGRRDFQTNWGNSPASAEVTRTVARDDKTLLSFGSAVTFDNRFQITASPVSSALRGVYHEGLLDMNFDPVSSLRGKAPSLWESLWTGINTLQIINGIFASTDKCFAFTYNQAFDRIELYEITAELLPGQVGNTYDNNQTPITWEFETAALFNADRKPRDVMVSLRDGEIGVSNVIGQVRFAVYWRPDEHSCWVPWHSFEICSAEGQVSYYPRLGLGEPSASRCISSTNTPARDFYTCQVKVVVQGTCTFTYARFMAVTMPTPKFRQPLCQDNVPVCVTDVCVSPADGSTDNLFYSLQDAVFTNEGTIGYVAECPPGFTCPPGSLPAGFSYPARTFIIPNPMFNGGDGPTPGFSTLLSLKGCSAQVSELVVSGSSTEQLATVANTIITAIGQQQAVCDATALLVNP